MEIKIGIGIDNIFFGMKMEDVKTILGEPDKVSDTEKEEGVVFYFNKKMLKVKFDKEYDSKLYSFEVFEPETIMFERKIINTTKHEIECLLMEYGYSFKCEDYTHFETLFCEEIWSTFMFEFGKLRGIEFSPLFDQNDEIIWPQIKL